MLALFWCIKVYGRLGDTDHWVYCDTVQYPVLHGRVAQGVVSWLAANEDQKNL